MKTLVCNNQLAGYNVSYQYPTDLGGFDFSRALTVGGGYMAEFMIKQALVNVIIRKAFPDATIGNKSLNSLLGEAGAAYSMAMGHTPGMSASERRAFDRWYSQPSIEKAFFNQIGRRGNELKQVAWKDGDDWQTDPKQEVKVVGLSMTMGTGEVWGQNNLYHIALVTYRWIAQGIVDGKLNWNYLSAAIQNFSGTPPKFPVFQLPQSLGDYEDTVARASYSAFLESTGYMNAVRSMKSVSRAEWESWTEANDRRIAMYDRTLSVLNVVSGKAVVDAALRKVDEYMTKRQKVIDLIGNFNVMVQDPAVQTSPTAVAKMQQVEADFVRADNKVMGTLNSLGVTNASYGQEALGGVSIAIAGIKAGTAAIIAGAAVWGLSILTSADRIASETVAEQRSQALDSIAEREASLRRSLEKDEITEAQYRQQLEFLSQERTELPPPPDRGLGATFKYLGFAVLAGAGLLIASKTAN